MYWQVMRSRFAWFGFNDSPGSCWPEFISLPPTTRDERVDNLHRAREFHFCCEG